MGVGVGGWVRMCGCVYIHARSHIHTCMIRLLFVFGLLFICWQALDIWKKDKRKKNIGNP